MPAGQTVQADAPRTEYLPAGHGWQTRTSLLVALVLTAVAPVTELNVPAGHLVHVLVLPMPASE